MTLLAALTATSLGIAVPQTFHKLADEFYPCMDCPCGCTSAEICWRDCCCFTNRQKLTWARENGVAPPAFVSAAVEELSCCQEKLASYCRSESSCCKKATGDTSKPPAWRKSGETAKRKSVSVVLIQALKCQGLSFSWTLLPPTILSADLAVENHQPGLSEQLLIADQSFSGQLPPPEVPPPEHDA